MMQSDRNSERVSISVYARNLTNRAGWQTSDPFAVVTLLEGTKSKILGKTEVIDNSLNPNWTKTFDVDYSFGRSTYFNVGVWDATKRYGQNISMGSSMFEIGDILGSQGSVKCKRLREGGILFVMAVKHKPALGKLKVSSIRGHHLKNVEVGLFSGKSDPFFTISKNILVQGQVTPIDVYRSDYCKNNLNPVWTGFEIGMDRLYSDLDHQQRQQQQHIVISLFDHEHSGRHTPMGSVEIPIVELLQSGGNATFPLQLSGSPAGSIEFIGAQIDEMALSGLSTVKQPTFIDYISSGCEIHMCVAIDFTGSNGDPRMPGTLHYVNPDGVSLNQYQKALTAISSILMKYDSDKKIPVLGFGAKLQRGGVLNNCFQCGSTPEADGINGILEAYQSTLWSGITLSGPTFFKDIIQHAASRATQNHELAMRKGGQAYTILLVLTDGVINDIEPTKQALYEASLTPLSVVIIGVGNADFGPMQFLDDFMTHVHSPYRDIVQFVPFSMHAHDKSSLTAATLEEIPQQLVTFFTGRNIQPLPMKSVNYLNVTPEPYNVETDIDLSLDFKGEDEIEVIGNAPVIDQTSYGLPQASPPPLFQASIYGGTASSPPMAPYAPAVQNYSTSPPVPSSVMFSQQYPPAPSYGAVPPYSSSFTKAERPMDTSEAPAMIRVQVPQGVMAGQKLEVHVPQTGKSMLVTVPEGIAPGAFFDVRAS